MQPRRTRSLLLRLLLAYLVPTLVLLSIFAFMAHREANRRLEASLGQHLIGIAQATASELRPESIAFLGPGDDDSRTARRLHQRLDLLQRRTRVARIVVLDRSLRSRGDSLGLLRIGDRYYNAEADRRELRRVFAGTEASSVLFTGLDGRLYKTGYAPLEGSGQIEAVVAVQGSPEYFEVLDRLRRYLILSGLLAAALIILLSVLQARRITKPLRRLAREARRIGEGQLEAPVPVESTDEVGLLAATLNEMRQSLHEREREMQMMLSGIAHEVRNPLGGIELWSGLLWEDLESEKDEEKLDKLRRIQRELGYLKRVVEDFLDFARRRPPELRPLSLLRLCHEAAEVLTGEAATRGLVLSCEALEQPDRVVLGDMSQLRRVLLNLLSNAMQASSEGQRVTLRCGTLGNEALLEVLDQGAGIEAEKLEAIFTPFYTTREKGSGLGLALCRKIVAAHGGRIEVRSHPGQGSAFRVLLPLSEEPASAPATPPEPGEELIG